jgi:hypothetical protein
VKNRDFVALIAIIGGSAPLFWLGHVGATLGALDLLDRTGTDASTLLHRHQSGDWGSICETNGTANDDALRMGGRLLSAYELGPRRERLWIITEADRSTSTLLLPEEY